MQLGAIYIFYILYSIFFLKRTWNKRIIDKKAASIYNETRKQNRQN